MSWSLYHLFYLVAECVLLRVVVEGAHTELDKQELAGALLHLRVPGQVVGTGGVKVAGTATGGREQV